MDPIAAPSWRQAAPPYPEIASGAFRTSGFAARLEADPAPGASAAFFVRTHVGPGLSALLTTVLRRLAGGGGPPVIPLQAGFGGGKTHALAAVLHATGRGDDAPGAVAGAALAAGVRIPPQLRRAVFVGTEQSPARPWPAPVPGGPAVATLWQDLAAQLRLAVPDAAAPPGAAELTRWLDDGPPCALLLDELVAWLRALAGGRALAAGSLDANLTFLQALTEAVRRSRAAVLLVTLPRSGAEAGGPGGEAALARLGSILGRGGAPWRPDTDAFGPILRQRLLEPSAAGAAQAAAGAYAGLYAAFPQAFPAACLEPAYRERLAACHPLHPALIDQLRGWCADAGLPGVRGALHVLAEAACLPDRGGGPLLLPGDLPLEEPGVRSALAQHRHGGWAEAVAADLADLPAPAGADPSGAAGLPRRALRALALASPPGGAQPGLEPEPLCRGVLHPSESPAALLDALDGLRRHAAHLHAADPGGRVWLDPLPGPNLAARRRAESLTRRAIEDAICERLEAELRRVERPARFAAAVPPRREGVVADLPRPRLVVLPPWLPFAATDPNPALERAEDTLRHCGPAARVHRNSLVFLAAEAADADALEAAVRAELAWEPEAAGRAAEARAVAVARLRQAYRWLLVPVQDPGGPPAWETIALEGEGPLRPRAAEALEAAGLLIAAWSPRALRVELDRLWPDGRPLALDTLWEDLTRYPYLPRLCGPEVLAQAVEAGVRDGSLALDTSGERLLRPAAAFAPPPTAAPAAASRRLQAEATLRGADAASAARRWLQAVVDPLAPVPGVRLHLTLRLEADLPEDAPAEVARTVRENARTLGRDFD